MNMPRKELLIIGGLSLTTLIFFILWIMGKRKTCETCEACPPVECEAIPHCEEKHCDECEACEEKHCDECEACPPVKECESCPPPTECEKCVQKECEECEACPPPSESMTYSFHPQLDSTGNDIKREKGWGVPQLMNACSADETCKGFNSNGYLKNKINPRDIWNTTYFTDPNKGLYIKM